MTDNVSRRKFLQFTGGSLALASLAACTSTSPASQSTAANSSAAGTSSGSSAAASGGEIGLLLNGLVAYTKNLATGVAQALDGSGYTLTAVQSDFTDTKVLANFQNLVSRKVKGILVLPNTPQSLERGTKLAAAAGIPVVDLDWSVPTAVDSTLVGRIYTDEVAAAKNIAAYMGAHFKPAEVVLISGVKGNPASDAFQNAFKPAVQALGGGWGLVGVEPGNYDRNGAIKATQNLLTAHPNAKVVVSFAAVMGDGIASYLKQRNLKDITNICVDGDVEMLSWMKQGWIKADGYFSSARQGLLGTQVLLEYLKTAKRKSDLTMLPVRTVGASDIEQLQSTDPLIYPKFAGVHIG